MCSCTSTKLHGVTCKTQYFSRSFTCEVFKTGQVIGQLCCGLCGSLKNDLNMSDDTVLDDGMFTH